MHQFKENACLPQAAIKGFIQIISFLYFLVFNKEQNERKKSQLEGYM